MRIVCPPACSRRNSSRTSWPPSESNAPVGSSASTSVGSLRSARAIASRCRWPPDSTPGTAFALSPRRAGRAGRAPASPLPCACDRRRSPAGPRSRAAHALEQVEELEDDADVPPAHAGQLVSDRPVTSSPSSVIVPSSAVSRPATRLRSVDLPQPDGPITATNSPRAPSSGRRRAAPGQARSRLERLANPTDHQHVVTHDCTPNLNAVTGRISTLTSLRR